MEELHQMHPDGEVSVLIIDVKENKSIAQPWAAGHGLTFPVLLDVDGEVATRFAPEGVLPDLPRDQIPIGSNLIIDPEGKIQFYTLLDTKNFDARLVALKERLYSLREAEKPKLSTAHAPAELLAISLDPLELVTLQRGNSAAATIAVTVGDGYHVLADDGGEKSLIPLRIGLAPDQVITIEEVTYPESESPAFLGSELTVGVYSGKVQTRISCQQVRPQKWGSEVSRAN